MTDTTRIKIAATITALFLAGISAVGLAARTDKPQAAAASTAAPVAQQAPTQTPGAAPTAAYTDDDDEDDDEAHDDERFSGGEHDD